MPIPPYVRHLRDHVGHTTLLLPAVAAVIRDQAGGVLLIQRGDGRGWSLPGGIVEPEENVVASLIREVSEETGLQIEPERIVGVYSDPAHMLITYPNGDRAHLVSTTFACRIVGGELRPDGEEALDVTFFAPDSLPEGLVCDHRIRIMDALLEHERAVFQ